MRTVILESRHEHCPNALRFRRASGLLPPDIRAVGSNHRNFEALVGRLRHRLAFHHIAVTAETKAEAEAALLRLIDAENAELLVLARYMQILSDDLCRRLQGRAINIHHWLLPSCRGARP